MIRHHRRALIVASSDLTRTDVPPAWADAAGGKGRRLYDTWAACLPTLSEQPVPERPDPGEAAGDATPPRSPGT